MSNATLLEGNLMSLLKYAMISVKKLGSQMRVLLQYYTEADYIYLLHPNSQDEPRHLISNNVAF